MESKNILLIGGGGHCKSVLDSLLNLNEYGRIGIIDKWKINQKDIYGIPVIGSDEDLPKLFTMEWQYAFISLGSTGNHIIRCELFKTILDIGFEVPVLCDKSAIVSKTATIGSGTFVGKRAVINTDSVVGNCSIINTGAIIEHDCLIGNLTHISPGVTLCGGVSVGNGAHIGAGSVIRQQLTVGDGSIIGIGSIVTKNIPDRVMAFGNPCKVVKAI